MRKIELYDEKDAKQDMDASMSGIESSIKKWNMIISALTAISFAMSDRCGLCFENHRKYSAFRCYGCVLETQTLVKDYATCCTEYEEVRKAFNILNNKVFNLRQLLESKRQDG